ncbi:hypothetical protein P3T76_012132 [Phytophthora citrophthora]|uniref:Uncharacterized protein n=1 Tax=Phytophthora citrophthora TaxID=4793 RepID=A0AAD9G649_9STRA|nr:hypothetical protein P3T76_012132 [Phytophthora citrophthora]
MEIECPFGLDANDIDLEERLLQIKGELTVVLIRSQYYFITGGGSLSHIPQGYSDSSWRQMPYAELESKAELTNSFSFHQGRLSSDLALGKQHELPKISEFTAIIHDSKRNKSNNVTNVDYGSVVCRRSPSLFQVKETCIYHCGTCS